MEIALHRHYDRRTSWIAGALLSLTALPLMATTSMEDEGLHPDPRHENVGELVTEFIQKSHYSHIAVDDSFDVLAKNADNRSSMRARTPM